MHPAAGPIEGGRQMSTVHTEIVTPAGKIYSDDVQMVIVRTTDGEIGVMPHHIPLVAPLDSDTVLLKHEDEQTIDYAAVHGGFIQVSPDHITILAEVAEMKDQIDVERAQRAYHEGKQTLGTLHKSDAGYQEARLKLKRAEVRLKTARTGEKVTQQ